VVQETRGWDESKQQTFSQRLKEGSADYRYFPEPDLPKFSRSDIPVFSDAEIRASLPELPGARRSRYAELGVRTEDAAFIAGSFERGAFFDAIIKLLEGMPKQILLAANYLVSDIAGIHAKSETEKYPAPETYAKLTRMIAAGEISSAGAKALLPILLEEGGDPEQIAKERGLLQVHDAGALGSVVEEVISSNPGPVADYKTGKEAAQKYLVGQAMKASKGAGNPSVLQKMLADKLAE
jgi:aspartyl-tRNA(Asn)/glutamyl-tRNA(Gln) amidotransferase subunit B